MKAPDKIYLEKSLSNPDRLHSQWYPNDVIGGGIEYIRKDALIEWLRKRYQQTISNVGCYTGHSVWAEVIEKLESL